jgi:hypothetical protein
MRVANRADVLSALIVPGGDGFDLTNVVPTLIAGFVIVSWARAFRGKRSFLYSSITRGLIVSPV